MGDGNYTFAGGYLIRSTDDGKTWEGPFDPGSPLPVEHRTTMLGKMPLYNRGHYVKAATAPSIGQWHVTIHMEDSQCI